MSYAYAVKTISEKVAARYIQATWGKATQYLDVLRRNLERRGRVVAWAVRDAGNVSTILDFEFEARDGGVKSGRVELRGDAKGANLVTTKWVRYEGAFYNSPTKLAEVILGEVEPKAAWTP